MHRKLITVPIFALCASIASAQPINTVGVMTEETNTFVFTLANSEFVSRAEVSADLSGLTFTHDFSTLSETLWTVE